MHHRQQEVSPDWDLCFREIKVKRVGGIAVLDFLVESWGFYQAFFCMNIVDDDLGPECPFDGRKIQKFYRRQRYFARRADLALEDLFEIIDVPYLAWLGHSLAILESFDTIVGQCFLGGLAVATVQKIAANQCPSPALTGIAVDHHDVLSGAVEINKYI